MPSFGKFYFSIRKPFFISAVPVLSASFLAIFFLLRGQMLLMPSIDYLLQFIRSKPSPVWARAWVWVKPLSSSQWLPFFHMVSCYQCHLLTTFGIISDQNLPQPEPEPGCGWNLYPLRSSRISLPSLGGKYSDLTQQHNNYRYITHFFLSVLITCLHLKNYHTIIFWLWRLLVTSAALL